MDNVDDGRTCDPEMQRRVLYHSRVLKMVCPSRSAVKCVGSTWTLGGRGHGLSMAGSTNDMSEPAVRPTETMKIMVVPPSSFSLFESSTRG